MNHNESVRLQRAVASMRQSGGIANLIADSKVDAVIAGLSKTMGDDWTYADLETELKQLVADCPSVKLETDEATAAAKEAARLATPDPKRMTASERLAHANREKDRAMKAAAEESAKANTEHTFEQLRSMSPAQRLELSRTWKALGADEPEPKPLSAEQIRKLDAMQRLSVANLETANAKGKKP